MRAINVMRVTVAAVMAATSLLPVLYGQSPEATFVAVMRADRSLVPIAIYDGGEWWNRWPTAGEDDDEINALPIPRSLAAIPRDWLPPGLSLPSAWTLLTDSGRRLPIRATQLVRPAREMTTTFAIQSNYRGPANPSEPSADVGVAIAGRGELGSFRPPSTLERQRILDQLSVRLAAVEKEALTAWLKEYAEQIDAEPVALTPTKRWSDTPTADAEPFALMIAARPHKDLIYADFSGEKLFELGSKRDPGVQVESVLLGDRRH